MLSAEQILRIPISDPGQLFPHDPIFRRTTYRELAKRWHPDLPNGSKEVFSHINILHKAAEDGKWDFTQVLEITEKGFGKKYHFRYLAKHPFELGDLYIGKNFIGWYIKHDHDELVLNGLKAIGLIKFPDDKLKSQHERFIPKVHRTIPTDNGYLILMKKTEDVIHLGDLIKHLGSLPPRHMAWVVSSLLNILCFYEIIGITHNGLSIDTVFVSPEHHAAFPLGGWWYSLRSRQRLKYLPPSVHTITPHSVLTSKVANIRTDLASVRAIARASIGDPTGARLQSNPDIPKPLANWLRLPPPLTAIDDYENWQKVLDTSWGKRRFLKLEVSPSAIYKPEV